MKLGKAERCASRFRENGASGGIRPDYELPVRCTLGRGIPAIQKIDKALAENIVLRYSEPNNDEKRSVIRHYIRSYCNQPELRLTPARHYRQK